jgi:poly-gamma-glutamate synthesis protein (capsule biosynthesis protein)
VNGLELAFLAFDDISSPLDVDSATQAIRSACESGALVIVSVHWGMEYQAGATDRQQSLAQAFADAGASLIWGHHPHVLQRAAWLETAEGRTLVLYSLGNALFDQGALSGTTQSALLLVQLDSSGVKGFRFIPFLIDPVTSTLLEPDEEISGKIMERLEPRVEGK